MRTKRVSYHIQKMDWALLLKQPRAVFGDCCCACCAQHHIRRTRIGKVHRVKWNASNNGRPLHLYQNSSQCMSIIDDLAIYHITHGSLDFLIFNFPRVRHHFCASHLWRIGSLWKQTKRRSRATEFWVFLPRPKWNVISVRANHLGAHKVNFISFSICWTVFYTPAPT